VTHINRRNALKAVTAAAGVGLSGALDARAEETGEALSQPDAPGKYLILACDGGGIRGYLTALIIEHLQKAVPFIDQVNLFAGTSTGSIIALGLAKGLTPADLVDLYRNDGSTIFDRHGRAPEPTGRVGRAWKTIKQHAPETAKHIGFNLKDLLRAKYPKEGLDKVLTGKFREAKFRDLEPGKAVVVTTLRLHADSNSWAPLVFHNLDVLEATANTRVEDGPTPDTTLVDAIMCSCAAPLYFPPHKHPEFGYCVDGGLFANCPASVALALADRAHKKKSERAGKQQKLDVRVLSIGTGAQLNRIEIPAPPFETAEEYGALAWLSPLARGKDPEGEDRTPAFPLVSALFDASSAAHNYICKQLLGDDYLRVQVYLEKAIPLDASDPATLGRIEKAAEKHFETEDWKATLKWLKGQVL
jgi:patatin-like phospholipase/acyl hydrolase